MIALIQRVLSASVVVAGETIGEIDSGLLALIGVRPGDSARDVGRLTERLLGYRVFTDEAGKMNRSLADTGGGLLLVPQFTLAADTRSGTRASFTAAAAPDQARELFDALVAEARRRHGRVETGRFGAEMNISLTNHGPVTFWLES
ncbi:D-aminoacyl-tRNA deacylase [Niveibacterium terrae]|uniref:D-aminoacyl-tRNA deacylase n=1 Tax=Niveibacterium terrae TaxID=3373598 RepID=UPI003A9283E3